MSPGSRPTPRAALRRLRPAVATALVVVLGGCSPGAPAIDPMVEMGTVGAATPATSAGVSSLAPPLRGPPPIRLRAGAHEISLAAWTFCWSDLGCADGRPPASPPDVGDPQEIEVGFAASGWHFTATAQRTGVRCGQARWAPLEQTGPTTFRLRPLGPRGDYVIWVAGQGDDGADTRGDVVTSIRWHTPRAGPAGAGAGAAAVQPACAARTPGSP